MNEQDPVFPHDDLDAFLREHLREAPVPKGLKESLLAIAEQDDRLRDPVGQAARRRASRRRIGWFVVVAATGLLSLVIWRQIPNDPSLVEEPNVLNIETELKQSLAEIRLRKELLLREIAAIELEEIVTRHGEKQSQPIPELSDRETVSLAFALSGELMHAWAGATPVVKEQLNQVVRAFPDTKGSELAARILSN
ncbi:MAG: hypothetical protein JNL67_01205 [Planctomycetaceae bacterium]|nr:hypothetical protein [Planctomycetaceae bacterium]